MTELKNPTTKSSLLKLVSPFNYQTKTGKTTLLAVDTQAEITIVGQNKRFWITDFVPVIYNSDGTIPDGKNFPIDDISVHITIGSVEMTDQAMPLLSLLHRDNTDLFAGKIIEPNNSIVFRFASKHLGSPAPICKYPLTIYMTIKGYDLPSY
jgi:hypothetical protein